MTWANTCTAVIPCLDEARTIASLVAQVRVHVPRVLVVDDGSTDATGDLAAAAGAVVLRHPRPAGKGAALIRGWEEAARLGCEWALLLDGDGQHAPEDIPAFFETAARTGADLVVGNRFARPAVMPWTRRATNLWMSRRLATLAGVDLPDSQCGFRLARVPALMAAPFRTRHYQIESEMLVEFARAGRRIAFVPIEVRYGGERSKIAPWRDGWRWWRWYRATPPVVKTKSPPAVSNRGTP